MSFHFQTYLHLLSFFFKTQILLLAIIVHVVRFCLSFKAITQTLNLHKLKNHIRHLMQSTRTHHGDLLGLHS